MTKFQSYQSIRVLRYDTRGHGVSDVPAGPYSFDRLGRDVIELLDGLHIQQVYFCGLSLGRIIGQWLGIHNPERIKKLVLSNTSAFVITCSRGLAALDPWLRTRTAPRC